MFNVIKGNIINKNVKPVVINPHKGKKRIVEESVSEQDVEERQEEFSEYPQEYLEEQNERLLEEIEILEETIKKKEEEIKEIELKAEKIITDAKMQADSIIEKAKEDVEEELNDIKGEAWEAGYIEGKNIGKEEIMLQAEETYKNAYNLLESASTKRKEILIESKKEVLDLAFMIAEKIIKVEAKNKEVLYKNLADAMEKAPKSKELKIYVNVEDFQLASEIKEFVGKTFRAMDAEIIEDYSLERGGVIIETKLGKVDASIKGQLEALYDSLEEV